MSNNSKIVLKQNTRWNRSETSNAKSKSSNKRINYNSRTPWNCRNKKRKNNKRMSRELNYNKKKKVFNVSNANFPSLIPQQNPLIQKNTVWGDISKKGVIKQPAVFINKNAHYCAFTKRRIKKGMEIVGINSLSGVKLYFDGLNNLKRYNSLHKSNLKRLEIDSNGNRNLFDVTSILDSSSRSEYYSDQEYYSDSETYSEDEYY